TIAGGHFLCSLIAIAGATASESGPQFAFEGTPPDSHLEHRQISALAEIEDPRRRDSRKACDCLSGRGRGDSHCIVRQNVSIAFITPTVRKRFGKSRTSLPSWRKHPNHCSARWCSRWKLDSGKPTYWRCRGRHMTDNGFGCGKPRPIAALISRSRSA